MFFYFVYFFYFSTFYYFVVIAAVDEFHLSDDYRDQYQDGESVYVIKNVKHSLQALATNTGPGAQLKWELYDGERYTYLDHDSGFPKTVPNSDDPNKVDTLGQVCFRKSIRQTKKGERAPWLCHRSLLIAFEAVIIRFPQWGN